MKVKLLYGLIVTFVVLSALIASSILSNPVVGTLFDLTSRQACGIVRPLLR